MFTYCSVYRYKDSMHLFGVMLLRAYVVTHCNGPHAVLPATVCCTGHGDVYLLDTAMLLTEDDCCVAWCRHAMTTRLC
jgi:hypothetical protein